MINKKSFEKYISEPFDKEQLMKFREKSKYPINQLKANVFKKELKINNKMRD